jgi:two-component system, NarL family, response regulator LiaR
MSDNTAPIRVALVDDHTIVRKGVRAFLQAQNGIVIAGEASSGEEAIQCAAGWLPEVIIMDVHMPGGIDGIETTRRLKATLPEVHIIVLSSFSDDSRLIGAMRAGAITYVQKEAEPEVLLNAVRHAALGQAVMEPELMQRIMQAKDLRFADTLTERELDVLKAVADGLTNGEIARHLHIGEETVKTHISSVLRKLGLAHRTQAAVYALRTGLVR